MKIVMLILWLLPCCCLAGGWQKLSHYKMGIEYVTADPEFPELFGAMGANATKVGLIRWALVEPQPPRNGVHHYNDALLRRVAEQIDRYRAAGMRTVHMVLKSDAPWAVYPVKANAFSPSHYPRPGYEAHYVEFVRHVTRFFSDHGVRYFEIESEAQHGGYWQGTPEQYGKLLALAHGAVKSISPRNRVILSGINFTDIYDDFPTPSLLSFRRLWAGLQPASKKAGDFIRYALAQTDFYDDIEFHYNRQYTGAYGTVAEIRNFLAARGVSKPIWAGDAALAPFFESEFVPVLTPAQGKWAFGCLDDDSLPCHEPVKRRYQQEQAKALVKKMVVGMELGLQGIMAGNTNDWPDYGDQAIGGSWVYQGFVDGANRPRPVYSTFRVLARRVSTARRMRRLEGYGRDVYVYLFEGESSQFLIAWAETPGNYPVRAGRNRSFSFGNLLPCGAETTACAAKAESDRLGNVWLRLNSIPIVVEPL